MADLIAEQIDLTSNESLLEVEVIDRDEISFEEIDDSLVYVNNPKIINDTLGLLNII